MALSSKRLFLLFCIFALYMGAIYWEKPQPVQPEETVVKEEPADKYETVAIRPLPPAKTEEVYPVLPKQEDYEKKITEDSINDPAIRKVFEYQEDKQKNPRPEKQRVLNPNKESNTKETTFYEIYTIEKNDTLYKISRKFYETKNKTEELQGATRIREANPWLENENLLQPGKKLRIPLLHQATGDRQKKLPQELKNVVLPTLHKVAMGETLYTLAYFYYRDEKQWMHILEANPGLDPCNLKAGMAITIPACKSK